LLPENSTDKEKESFMRKYNPTEQGSGLFNILRGTLPLSIILILIEFFDELVFSFQGAALPAIRDDLALSYEQVGMLFAIPALISTFLEPLIMLLGDTRLRKHLILSGGVAFLIAIMLTAGSTSFAGILLAFIISYPASGAFVTLSQATLMGINPGRETQAMARWTLAGSLASFSGPLIVAVGFAFGFSWRWAYWASALIAIRLIWLVKSRSWPAANGEVDAGFRDRNVITSFIASGKEALNLMRSKTVIRWLMLLQLSDLMLDIFLGFVPLYLADVTGLDNQQISLILSALMVINLGSDALLIPLLKRFHPRNIVRTSSVAAIVIYASWLLLAWPATQVILLLIIRLSTIGWYQILQGEVYAAANGRSGAVNAIGTLTGLLGAALTWLIGWVASQAGLPTAMWLLMLAPLSLAIFVPRPVFKGGIHDS
jgi:FSR family fosmidomycin resistance protein-like MFS transporter